MYLSPGIVGTRFIRKGNVCVNVILSVCVCLYMGGARVGGREPVGCAHNTRVIVVAAVPLCDNGGFQERGREELSAPPAKTIC